MQLSCSTTLQGGKYKIIRVLGQGGFGITYLAYNTLLDKHVALKEFFPKSFCGRDATSHLTLGTQDNAETVANLKKRFLKEAKNIAQLDHQGIVRIHDIFEENNTAYYVMEYIEGDSLASLIKEYGPMPENRAIKIISSVAKALEYIHSRNMTHFDVKPANIVMRSSDNQPVLIDFGLSKQYDDNGEATSTLMQAVSHGYSPLELYNAGAITGFSPQTDVYSLGATLYTMVTGKIPPAAAQIVEAGLTFTPEISENVRSAIEHAMTPGRKLRTKSIGEFLKELPDNSDQKQPPVFEYDEETHVITKPITEPITGPVTGPPLGPFPPQKESPKSKVPGFFSFKALLLVLAAVVIILIIWNNTAKEEPEIYQPPIYEIEDEYVTAVPDDSSAVMDSLSWY